MSIGPNDPSHDPFDQGRQNTMAAGDPDLQPAGSGRKKGCLIGCGVFGLLSVLVCCGGGMVLINMGASILAEDFQRQLAGHPLIEEHVGDVESFDFSLVRTAEESRRAGEDGEAIPMSFEVTGTKGEALIVITQDQQGQPSDIETAVMVLPDGTRLPMEIEPPANDVGDIDVEGLEDLEMMIDMGTEQGTPPGDPSPQAGPDPVQPDPTQQDPTQQSADDDESTEEESSSEASDADADVTDSQTDAANSNT